MTETEIEIRPKDLNIWVYTPEVSGSWATALNMSRGVAIQHIPTGLVFKNHTGRSQWANKELGLQQLHEALVEKAAKKAKRKKKA